MLIHHMVTPAGRYVLLAVSRVVQAILNDPPYIVEENKCVDRKQSFVELERARLPLLKYRVMQQRAPPRRRTHARPYLQKRYAEGCQR